MYLVGLAVPLRPQCAWPYQSNAYGCVTAESTTSPGAVCVENEDVAVYEGRSREGRREGEREGERERGTEGAGGSARARRAGRSAQIARRESKRRTQVARPVAVAGVGGEEAAKGTRR